MAVFSTDSRQRLESLSVSVLFGDSAPVKVAWKWKTFFPGVDTHKRGNFASDQFSLDCTTKLSIGQHISARLCTIFGCTPVETVIIDAFGRNGSNSIHFGNHGFHSIAFAENQVHFEIMRHNISVFELTGLVSVLRESCLDNANCFSSNSILFLDPAWESNDASSLDNTRFSSSRQQSMTFLELLVAFSLKTAKIAIKLPSFIDSDRLLSSLRVAVPDFDILSQDLCPEGFKLVSLLFRHQTAVSDSKQPEDLAVGCSSLSSNFSFFSSSPAIDVLSNQHAVKISHQCSLIKLTSCSDVSESELSSIASYLNSRDMNANDCRAVASNCGLSLEKLINYRRNVCEQLCGSIRNEIGADLDRSSTVLCCCSDLNDPVASSVVSMLGLESKHAVYSTIAKIGDRYQLTQLVDGNFDIIIVFDLLGHFSTPYDVIQSFLGYASDTCKCIVIEKDSSHAIHCDPIVAAMVGPSWKPYVKRLNPDILTTLWAKRWSSSRQDASASDLQITNSFPSGIVPLAAVVTSRLLNVEGWLSTIFQRTKVQKSGNYK